MREQVGLCGDLKFLDSRRVESVPRSSLNSAGFSKIASRLQVYLVGMDAFSTIITLQLSRLVCKMPSSKLILASLELL